LFHRYGFDKVESKHDFDSKLDKAIVGLESEINEKRRSVQALMDELGLNKKNVSTV